MAIINLKSSRSCALLLGTVFLLLSSSSWGCCSVEASDEWVCVPPTTSTGPLPPILPESYHMVYELNDLTNKNREFYDVWFDWRGQRSKVEVISGGLGATTLSFYNKDTAYTYIEPRPGVDESEDEERDFVCMYSPIKGNPGDDPVPFFDPKEKPLRMVDIYQALLFGGRYRYAFVNEKSDEISRFVLTNRFSTCIVDRISGEKLNITYHWTVDETLPVLCQIVGQGENATNQILSVVRFDRDPVMTNDIFQVPRHMHCQKDPAEVARGNFPPLSPSFAWRQETVEYETNSNGRTVGSVAWGNYLEMWVSDYIGLVRVDWTPSADEDDGSLFDDFAGVPIEAIADIEHNSVFITNKITGECFIEPLTSDFPFIKTTEEATLKLKTPHELMGLTEPHINKSKVNLQYNERGNQVIVLSRLDRDNNTGAVSIHEATFRYDEKQGEPTDGHFSWVPVSQLSRTIVGERNNAEVVEQVRQTSYFHYRSDINPLDDNLDIFTSPGCIALHERRFFMLSFPGEYADIVLPRKAKFLSDVRHALFTWAHLGSIMRIQDLDVFKFKTVLNCTFTIINLPDFSNQSKTDIEAAKKTLTDVVDGGKMFIPLPDSEPRKEISPIKQSFYEIAFAKASSYLRTGSAKVLLHRSARSIQKSSAVNDTGYTDLSLAGVCVGFFLIGIVVGFVVLRYWAFSGATSDDAVPLAEMQESSTELTGVRPKTPRKNPDEPGPSGWSSGQA